MTNKSKLLVQDFLQKSSNVFAENRLLKGCCLVMALVTLINAVSLYQFKKAQRVIILPAWEASSMKISGTQADLLYLRRMGRYLLHLKEEFNASNVYSQFEELLHFVHPTQYARLKRQLDKEAAIHARYKQISYAINVLENVPIEKINDQAFYITLNRRRIIGDRWEKSQNLRYRIDYKIENGRFWLMDLQEINRAA